MYYRYFGLTEAPFSIAPNPHYLYMSPHHRDALAHLLYGVGAGGGFILLTGEVGTGKTTITRCLLEQLPDNIDLAMVLNPALNAQELLATACDELGIANDQHDTLKTLTDKLHQFLLQNHAQGRNTVLLVDEAQHLQPEVLEQVRLLTNLETNTKKLLQIVLVGQPELNAILARPELRQLNQRITARYKILPLSYEETRAYVNHRLQVAGLPGGQALFPESVIKGIYQKTGGLPRLINLLCDRILMGTYGQNKTHVDQLVFKQAVAEVFDEEPHPKGRSKLSLLLLASAAVIVITGVLAWHWHTSWQLSPNVAASPTRPQAVATPLETLDPADESEQTSDTTQSPPSELPIAPIEQAFLAKHEAYSVLGKTLPESSMLSPENCSDPDTTAAWRCESLQFETWEEIRAINRPAILSLITPGRQKVYVALHGISDGSGRLATHSSISAYPLEALGVLWNGEATIVWRPPSGFVDPLRLGDTSTIVAWMAEGFAQLDGQASPLAESVYNRPLQQRIEIFQDAVGLSPDGVIGMRTLLRFQESIGTAVTLTANATSATPTTSSTVEAAPGYDMESN